MTNRTGGYRPYVAVDDLEGKPLAGNGQCVGIVEYYTRVGKAENWKQGERVRDAKYIIKGTAIATFVNGKYPNNPHGNHAALYMKKDDSGITMMDQWSGDNNKPTISSRYVKYFNIAQNSDGSWENASNNGDAFYVIEL
jgi:hypothetical protein